MVKQILHQPHDTLFKQLLKDPALAQEFFAAHLPPDILRKVDLSTLALQDKSFIDEAFKKTEADLVYSVQLEGKSAYIYLLCEQQTEMDGSMPLRLLGYEVRALQDHYNQHPKEPLPVIIPLVLYSGEAPWTAPSDIFPLFGEQAALARQFWSAPYTLIDVHRMTDDEIKQREFTGLMEYVLKYRQTREVERCLIEIFSWLERVAIKDIHQAIILGHNVLYYFAHVNPATDADTFQRLAKQHLASSHLQGEIMTLAQQFEQRGIEKGLQQGLQQGEIAIILNQLEHRFGSLPVHYKTQIEQAKSEQLLTWAKKVLDAHNLAEVFGG